MQSHFKASYSTIIKAPVEQVWEALTNPAIVKAYFFGSNLITDWKIGHSISFEGEYEGKPYQDKGIVQTFVPLQALSFSYLSEWSGLPDIPENYLLVSYEVQAVPEGTALTITQTNYDEERVKHSEENWAMVIDGLKKIVEKTGE